MTEANVMYMNEDSTIDSINVHDDGYLNGLGKMLDYNYQAPAKVRELISLGDVVSVGEVLNTFPLMKQFGSYWDSSNNIYDKHIPNTKVGMDFKQNIWDASKHFVDARNRDHGEEFHQQHFFDLSDVYQRADNPEYEYLFVANDSTDGNWLYRKSNGKFQSLDLKLGLSDVVKE